MSDGLGGVKGGVWLVACLIVSTGCQSHRSGRLGAGEVSTGSDWGGAGPRAEHEVGDATKGARSNARSDFVAVRRT